MEILAGFFDSDTVFSGEKRSPERTVELYELEVCCVGRVRISIDGKMYECGENTVICAKPGQIRYSILPFRNVYIKIKTDNKMIRSYLDALPDVMQLNSSGHFLKSFREIAMRYISPSRADELLLMGQVLVIIGELSKAASFAPDSGNMQMDEIITKALSYIEANFNKSPSLAEIAEHVKLSPIYFHNKFMNTTGITPHNYLLNRQITEAKRLLLETQLPVCTVAEMCGFSSQSYFNYTFKKLVGLPPLKYKRKMTEQYYI